MSARTSDVATSARGIVLSRVSQRARAFPDLALDPLRTEGLDARDANLATAIDHAVARRWLTLVDIIGHSLNRPWHELEPSMQAALLVGAAQLLLMDRLPDHAVINDTVEWTKQSVRPKAGGMVNAVLRRISELRTDATVPFDPQRRDLLLRSTGEAIVLSRDIMPDDDAGRTAVQGSVPKGLFNRWLHQFGGDTASQLALHGLVIPPIIMTTTDATGWPEDLDVTPHDLPGFAVFRGAIGDLGDIIARHPGLRVQDPSSAAAVELTRDLAPSCIIDVCAGQGTKTRQLAAMHPNAEIIATDVDDARRSVLRRSFTDADRVRIVEPSALMDQAGRGDLVVLDVPCSNTGVLARRVEARYRWSDASVAQLVDVQRQIIADAIPLLAAGGHLLYATCSIEPAENTEQSSWVRQWHDLREVGVTSRWPTGVPGDDPAGYSDGGYACLLAR